MMDSTEYIKEAHKQLKDTRYYLKLESVPIQEYSKEVQKIIAGLPKKKKMT